ncbi:MAG: rRNA maturation RNase YbeY [Chitinophagales bacterium]|nr:rRNA maturation RNase YbeY [Bacteroidota bacterium]MCB9042225.1 rRNA maturation RNase YbeY [Chitinophagales bacterium]
MPIAFFVEEPLVFKPTKIRHTKKCLHQLLEHYKYQAGNINYIFGTDDFLLEINRNFLQHDYYTDIITFDQRTDAKNKCIDADLYLSIDRIRDNAKQLQQTFAIELYRVMAHGLLHLVGFSDKTTTQQQQMRQAEDAAIRYFLEK